MLHQSEKLRGVLFQLAAVVRVSARNCWWCGEELKGCGLCKGSGMYRGSTCMPCKGQGRLCPVHQGDWSN